MSRWWRALAIFLASVVLMAQMVLTRDLSMLILSLAFLAFAWWVSPLNRRGGPRHADVEAHRTEHPVVIYWRPGCVFCLRLRGALGKDKRAATWINIWSDEDAATWVRSVNEGNETVPTVRIAEQVHTNPDPEVVRAALR